MPQPIKKLAESMPVQQDLPSTEAQPPQKKPWARMDGESLLWFNRFKLYKGLGPKRTLLAALEQERAKVKVLKSTEIEQKAGVSVSAGVATKKCTKAQQSAAVLTEVKPPKPQVPGSWKQASIKFRWPERATLYDEWVIDKLVESHLDDILTDAAIGIERVKMLKNMLSILQVKYNSGHNVMTYEQELAFFARMQSVLKDIKDEMSDYDEAITRVLIRHQAENIYKSATPSELQTGKIEVKRAQN